MCNLALSEYFFLDSIDAFYFFFAAPAPSAAFFASAGIQLVIAPVEIHATQKYLPAACFSLIFAATFSFSRCISDPDMEFPFFYKSTKQSA